MNSSFKDQADKLTKEEKLKLLGIPEDKIPYFNDVSAEITFEKLIIAKLEMKNRELLLEILNLILKELGKDRIHKINEFELTRTKLKQFNAPKFVEVHIEKFMGYGMSKNDLKYNHRKFIKGYYYTLLKSIIEFFGFNLETRKRNDINKKQITCYYCKKDF
jgi:hypothetical protein